MSITRKVSTKTNKTNGPPVDEGSPTPASEQNVRNFLIRETSGNHYIRATMERLLDNRKALVVVLAGLAFVVAVTGYLIGRASAAPALVDPSGGFFIGEDQAQELRQQATELSESRSRLAIAEGELAFLRTQVSNLTTDSQILQTVADRTQVELGIMIGVYEECLRQPYPAECVEGARLDAEKFIEELYASGR